MQYSFKGLAFHASKSKFTEKSKNLSHVFVFALFDHIIESAKIGLRKPDPRIYEMMVEALGVDPKHCVYLDDLGVNLKPARALGMQTIKVGDPDEAIAELEAIVGIPLKG